MLTFSPRSRKLVTPCSRTPQGTMPSKWREIGRQIDADAVEAHPVPDADSDGSNLVFPVSAPDPYANPVFAPLSGNTEGRQRFR